MISTAFLAIIAPGKFSEAAAVFRGGDEARDRDAGEKFTKNSSEAREVLDDRCILRVSGYWGTRSQQRVENDGEEEEQINDEEYTKGKAKVLRDLIVEERKRKTILYINGARELRKPGNRG
ncbi:hypothetical protein Pyn_15894 [Prunus yedoensis var. nudiflora]|uniref:Uncharacterized protein n=1 Tax=Prunus yedoensis var. nudiflora TaxID=2094558 RepID=A0A314ZSJ7_PRUYE|nr:hypothetical protein Pyn_15894 [Prunus yedoensis var. nudiflora]